MLISKWVPEENPKILRRVGKTAEEVAELSKVLSRIIIQGIGGRDPASGKTNIESLTEEIADVLAQCQLCVEAFDLDRGRIQERIELKKASMAEWEAMFEVPDTWQPGTLVRYSEGSTALMLVESVHPDHSSNNHRYYGRQCMGGSVGAYHSQITAPSDEDRATWARINPLTSHKEPP